MRISCRAAGGTTPVPLTLKWMRLVLKYYCRAYPNGLLFVMHSVGAMARDRPASIYVWG